MKYVITWEDVSYNDPLCYVGEGTMEEIGKKIEYIFDNNNLDDNDVERIKVFIIEKELEIERKVVVKEVTKVKVK